MLTPRLHQDGLKTLEASSLSWSMVSRYLDCAPKTALLVTRPFAINQEAGT